MRATSNMIKSIATLITVCLSLGFANSASAVLIDFNDLNPVYDDVFPCWCDNPLSDQYESQGVLINGGAWVNGSGPNNVMTIGSGGAGLAFVGALPTFVSMNVTSLQGDAIFLEAWGTSGFIESKRTLGWVGVEEGYIPAVPNELISFSSDQGISNIAIMGFYNLRVEADIDNITFTYASVPEPSSLALIGLGLFGILWRTRRLG